jgi:thiamine monophosphate kinase
MDNIPTGTLTASVQNNKLTSPEELQAFYAQHYQQQFAVSIGETYEIIFDLSAPQTAESSP